MKEIFIIGSKGIPANYGGFETFVENLTFNRMSDKIKYHVACLSDNNDEFIYNNARCFNVKVPKIGAVRAVYYDILALNSVIKYIKENSIKGFVVYVLASRIGPFIGYHKKQLERLGGKLYLNPDGHEWKRAKWNKAIKLYWKYSEKYMVKNADLIICDSKNIEQYIKNEYKSYNPTTQFIAYGADTTKSELLDSDRKIVEWYEKFKVDIKEYYLIVGRFVPENNYEVVIQEFKKSKTDKDLVIITNVEENKFYSNLKNKTDFDKDKRIKFVGTVYNIELLKKIRENAFGYLHGHEVGGTNPSLLEALALTNLNILLDVGFNREVAEGGALYFTKEKDNLKDLLNSLDQISKKEIFDLGMSAKDRINKEYTWDKIISKYEAVFQEGDI